MDKVEDDYKKEDKKENKWASVVHINWFRLKEGRLKRGQQHDSMMRNEVIGNFSIIKVQIPSFQDRNDFSWG